MAEDEPKYGKYETGQNGGLRAEFGHASLVLDWLVNARQFPAEHYGGETQKQDFVKQREDQVRNYVRGGRLSPQTIQDFGIPEEEPTDWRE